MKGDYSRLSFDSKKHYRAVLMQQGRLQLDSDWNEQVQIAEHRYSSFFRAMVGRSGTPRGGEIKLLEEGGRLCLTGGAYYIDGLLIENEALIELDWPGEPEDFLYYIDAWAREVSAAEDSSLVDSAVGVETTTRLKTEWVVRRQQLTEEIRRSLEEYKKGNWPQLSADSWWRSLSTGKLTLDAVSLKEGNNDSRLYRIEVHEDELGVRFKWSADNACTCAELTMDGAHKSFALKSDAKELRDAFIGAAWVELFIPGEVGKSEGFWWLVDMSEEDNFFDASKGILRLAPNFKEVWELLNEKTAAELEDIRIVMRRWDGVSAAGADSFELSDVASFSIAPTEFYRHGDYWLVQLRNGQIINWREQSNGVEHHFAALGIVNGTSVTNLSVVFDALTSPNLSTTGDVEIVGNLTVSGTVNATEFVTNPQRLDFDSGIQDGKPVELFLKTGWSASSNASWCTVTPASGNGNATVAVRVTENSSSTAAKRSATVTFTASDGRHIRTVSVTQPPLLAPVISGFIPSEGPHSSALSILGGNFNTTAASNNVVSMNGIESAVVSVTATQLTVTVPQNMNYNGRVKVKVGSKTATSSAATFFDYLPTNIMVGTLAGRMGVEWPSAIASDAQGNLYIADGYRIRKMTPAGVFTVLAGGTWGYADGTGKAARFSWMRGITIDLQGNLYVADSDNHCIRKVTPDGVVTTLAGGTSGGYNASGYADDTGSAARFSYPRGVTVDLQGNLYVADNGNHCIRKVTSAGVVTTLAGSTGGGYNASGYADSTGSAARFFYPADLVSDTQGNLYVVDSGNNCIRKVTPDGVVTTLAGNGEWGYVDGTGKDARFDSPQGVTIDAQGNLYVAVAYNYCIRKVTPTGVVTTFAGNGEWGYVDGTGKDARFLHPGDITIDAQGNLYVLDEEGDNGGNIRKVTLTGVVTTLAGSRRGYVDGEGCAAQFGRPMGMAIDAKGNLYVADADNHCIRKVTPKGVVTTLAGALGEGEGEGYAFPVAGYADGTGRDAQFSYPCGMAIDANDNLYVADSNNHCIRKVTPTGVVTTLAGSTEGGYDAGGYADGTGKDARFQWPVGITVDAEGNLYVADSNNHCIRKVTPTGVVTTLAGDTSGGYNASGYANGAGSAARFSYPSGITVDAEGNLYVADNGNHCIRKVTPDGVVTTLAGSSVGEGYNGSGYADGTGKEAQFAWPQAITLYTSGNLYVADSGNHCIRKVTPNGKVTTLAGYRPTYENESDVYEYEYGLEDGAGSLARFSDPCGIAIDAQGNLYVADSGNASIRKIVDE